jgi:hypothetical protein
MKKDRDSDATNPSITPPQKPGKLRDSEGITLGVVDGPHDGLLFGDDATAVTLGRGVGNSIELPRDPQVSRDHCVVRFSADDTCWILEDRGSANGTWYAGSRLSAPTTLENGAEFVVGTTAIRCSSRGSGKTFLPDAARIDDDIQGLIERLDGVAAQGYGAAAMLALREKSTVLTDRHLFLGLISANADISFISHGKGLINAKFLIERVNANDYWAGAKSWIAQLVCIGNNGTSLFADELLATPRVYRALRVAENQADSFGHEEVTSNNLLFGLFDDANGRIREWFLSERGDLKRLMAELSRPPTRVSKRPVGQTVTRRIPTDSSAVGRLAPRAKVIDPAVHNLAAATLLTATRYRLANAEDRRKAVRETVTGAIAGITPENRQNVLEQLRECFPVNRGVRVAELDAARALQPASPVDQPAPAIEDPAALSPPSDATIPWAKVLRPDSDLRQTSSLRPADAPAMDVVNHLVGFALAMEKFVIGIVAGLTDRSLGGIDSLPGFTTTIRRAINLSISGQPPAEEFKPYLAALETWLVATIAAYHQAPEDWFTEFWNKTGPTKIEAKVPAKFLSDAKCWSQYKNIVRRISPDLVGDEIQALVRKTAQDRYDELTNRRSSS